MPRIRSALKNWKHFNYVNISIIFGCTCAVSIVIFFLLVPPLINLIIAKVVCLRPGTLTREIYTKVPFAIAVKIYVFHVLNAVEVTRGAKPKLQEIGPYIFDEYKDKYDMVDNDVEDSVEFKMRNTFIFRPDLSNRLTGDEVITVGHPLIMGMALAVNLDNKKLLGMVSKAINGIFQNPEVPFWTGRVMDLLFDGIDIDCTSTQFAARSTCDVLTELKNIRVIDSQHLKFSIFHHLNASSVGVFKVRRGVKHIKDLGRMISFDGEQSLNVWGPGQCNEFHGTDSTIFPPRLKPQEGMWAFEPSMCLSMGAQYQGPSKYAGIKTREYTVDIGDISKDVDRHCYCMDPPKDCPRAGTIGIYQCIKAPLVISMPHFYKADPDILQHIDGGLNPNQAEHGMYAHYEYRTGTPLSGAKRLQFSIDVVPVERVESMKSVPEVLLPLFWVEESLNLNQTYTSLIKDKLNLAIKIIAIIKWLLIGIGATGCFAAAFLHSRKIIANRVVKPDSPEIEAPSAIDSSDTPCEEPIMNSIQSENNNETDLYTEKANLSMIDGYTNDKPEDNGQQNGHPNGRSSNGSALYHIS